MKKEQKRYFLVEFIGERHYQVNSKEELIGLLDKLKKYNNKKGTKYIVGNISIKENLDGKYSLNVFMYTRLSEKSAISDIDNYTSELDEKELIADKFDKLVTADPVKNKHDAYYPDINIAYFDDKNMNEQDSRLSMKIKYIPVLYKNDIAYLDRDYIDSCLWFHAKEGHYDFFKGLANEFNFYHNCSKEIEDLRLAIDYVKYQGENPTELYNAAMKLYDSVTCERNKDKSIMRNEKGEYQISRRRQRDFGLFVKNYNSTLKKSPLYYSYNFTSNLEEMRRYREVIVKERQRMIEALDGQYELTL